MAVSTESLSRLVNWQEGLVSRQVFVDKDIYSQELERIFTKCWLYLGHESQIEKPGDYMTNYMGEDPIMLCRDPQGKVRAFLNSCMHRGNKICKSDVGNSSFFRCSYHGWTYSNEGKLTGVPFHKEAYLEELDRERWGLFEVPRVQSYKGLIFGCWDKEAMSLEDYLGDLRWYLDVELERPLGNWEVVSGRHMYVSRGNWKTPAENFAGDMYHVPYAHGSAFKLQTRNLLPFIPEDKMYDIAFDHGHGLLMISLDDEHYQGDLAVAQRLGLGPEVTEYVEESYRHLRERVSEDQAKVGALGPGNIFPNFSFNDFGVFYSRGLYLWHPRGPEEMEAWEWCMVDSAAPAIIKEMATVEFTRGQSVSGFFGQDDTENFERVAEATRGTVARRLEFNYQMGLGHDGEIQKPGFPGRFAALTTEHNQRNFYRFWAELMDKNGHG